MFSKVLVFVVLCCSYNVRFSVFSAERTVEGESAKETVREDEVDGAPGNLSKCFDLYMTFIYVSGEPLMSALCRFRYR